MATAIAIAIAITLVVAIKSYPTQEPSQDPRHMSQLRAERNERKYRRSLAVQHQRQRWAKLRDMRRYRRPAVDLFLIARPMYVGVEKALVVMTFQFVPFPLSPFVGCGKWLRWTSAEASLPMPTPSTPGSIEFQVPDATMRLLQAVCDVPPGTGLDDSGRCSGRLAASEPPDPDHMKLVCAWRVQNPVRTKKYLKFRERARAAVASAPVGCQPREVSLKPSFANATRTLIEESPDQLRPLDTSIIEVLLLHGAKPEALFPMLFQGLDPEMARRTGLFGAGTYFAEDAVKVDQYATLDSKSRWKDGEHPLYDLHNKLYSHGLKHPKDVHYALVCRVVLGSNPAFTKDGKTRLDPGKEHQSLFADHTRKKIAGSEHALVAEPGGSVDRFREFVAFDPDAIDVEYLVAYKRERNYCDCQLPIVRRSVVANTENKDRPYLFCRNKDTENDCGFSRMLPLCYCDRYPPRFASVKFSKYGKFYGCGSKGAPECDFKQNVDGPSGDSGAREERRITSESPSKRQRTNQSLAFP